MNGGPARPAWVGFDIGGTLIHPSSVSFYAAAKQTSAEPRLLMAAFVRASEAYHWSGGSANRSRSLEESIREEFHLSQSESEQLVMQLVSGELYRQTDVQAASTLQALRDAGIRTAVLTNNDGRGAEQLDRAGLLGLIDVLVESAVLGIEKPSPEAFHALSQAVGIPVSEGWYVGDGLINDVLGSLDAGFAKAILYDRFDQWKDLPRGLRISSLGEVVTLANDALPLPP